MLRRLRFVIAGHFLFWLIVGGIQLMLSSTSVLGDVLSTGVYAVTFYINYFVVIPLMPPKKPQQGFLISLVLYLTLSVTQIYPMYTLFPEYVYPLEIVGRAFKMGAILHLSLFFYAISSMSRILVKKLMLDQKYLKQNIAGVLDKVDVLEAQINVNFLSKTLTFLKLKGGSSSKAQRALDVLTDLQEYKASLSEKEVLLSKEFVLVEKYVLLYNEVEGEEVTVIFRDDTLIKKGSALKAVETYLSKERKQSGIVLLWADLDKVAKISLRV